jgi:hypothetical protein
MAEQSRAMRTLKLMSTIKLRLSTTLANIYHREPSPEQSSQLLLHAALGS